MSKDEIKAKLKELGIAFDEGATKAELMALLPEGSKDSAPAASEDLDSELDAINTEKKEQEKTPEKTPQENLDEYLKIIAAYKKQDPEKYLLKKTIFEKEVARLKSLVQ